LCTRNEVKRLRRISPGIFADGRKRVLRTAAGTPEPASERHATSVFPLLRPSAQKRHRLLPEAGKFRSWRFPGDQGSTFYLLCFSLLLFRRNPRRLTCLA